MGKFSSVCYNEILKATKKKATLFFVLLLVLSLIICGVFTYFIKENNKSINKSKENILILESEIDFLDIQKKMLPSSASINEKNEIEARKTWYKYAMDNNIIIFDGEKNGYYKFDIIEDLISLTAQKDSIDSEKVKEKQEIENNINELTKILENNEFNKYIDMKINSLDEEIEKGNISKDQKTIYVNYYNYMKKYNIGIESNEINSYKNELLLKILESELLLQNDNLSIEEKQSLNNIVSLNKYYIENNIYINNGFDNIVNYQKFYKDISETAIYYIILIFVIVLASEIICSEYSQRTIKHTISVPIKRWKILLSKIIAIMLISLVLFILAFLICQIISMIFASSGINYSYTYFINNSIETINSFVYDIQRCLVCYLEICIYMFITLCIAQLTKKTGNTTAIVSFLAIAGTVFMNILISYFKNASLLKYIPFNNLHVILRVFPSDINIIDNMLYKNILANVNTSLNFSIIYDVIVCILMLVILFILWNRKDVLKDGSVS